MSTPNVLPRLPNHRSLLAFLKFDSRPKPAKFDLSETRDMPADEADWPCPICFYLKRTYGADEVTSEGWYDFQMESASGGLRLSLDANKDPAAIGILTSIRVMTNLLLLAETEDNAEVTLEELTFLVEHWENPHDAAETVLRARRLSSGGTTYCG